MINLIENICTLVAMLMMLATAALFFVVCFGLVFGVPHIFFLSLLK